MSFSSSIHSLSSIYVIVLAGGYRVYFFVEFPSKIYMSPDLQLMKASTVASQSLPNISGCPPRLSLRVMIMKSIGYSQEYKDTNTYSNTPSCLITNLFANYNNVVYIEY